MDSHPHGGPQPPRLLRLFARLLIHGTDAAHILPDLDASFTRDIQRGLGLGRSVWRYTWNVLGSAWSVWTTGLHRIATRGIGLDAKLGFRMLAKQPLITVVALLALGLGIPASLTLLHGADVLYGDLPIPDADRVVGVRHYDLDTRRPQLSSVHDYERWMNLKSFEALAAVRSYRVNINADEVGAFPINAAEVKASSFEILRAQPLLGRVLDGEDEANGAPDVVLLGEDLWSARFARDLDIVGQTVRIGRTPHTVVGIMPEDFRFPVSHQAWLPMRVRATDFAPGTGPTVFVFGRLADGVSTEEAEVEVAGFTDRAESEDPERFVRLVGEVVEMPFLLLHDDKEMWQREDMNLIQALVFGLLLVVCGNVGTLVLARTEARAAEIAIRTALGASRARILKQLFIEVLVLATLATGLGLLVANASAGHLLRVLDGSQVFPYWVDPTLTPRIVTIALGLTVLCAVVAGIVPALSATRPKIQANLQSAASRRTPVRFGIGSSLLIVSEIVLSVGFLAMGGSTLRGTLANQDADLGFDPEPYVVGTLTVPDPDAIGSAQATDPIARARSVSEVQHALLTRLSEDPSVVAVAMGAHVPGVASPNRTVLLETPLQGFEPIEWDILIPRVAPSFFAGLRRPILAGRDFNAGDVEGPPGTHHTSVIVNESFVRDMLGGRNAVGQRFRYERQGRAWGSLDGGEWYEIVGVVGPFGTNPRSPSKDAGIYHPLAPGEANPIRYTVEVADDPEAFVQRFRQIAASVDPEATADAGLLGEVIRTESLNRRWFFILVLALSSAAFLLSATGLYALLSFTVSQRTKEIGIRTALGAGTTDIVSAVARQAALQVGVGLTLGVGWGWVLLNSRRNDINLDVGNIPLTLALTVTAAACVCVLACAYPTLRGLRIQPTEALRES